ncbi:hypothetical protein [Flavobacterium sp.]|uniref:hypothetical protein n=1 Tax=Flavobacterium sp. TaxID=239 RepID=UPI00374CF2AB
MKILSKMSSQKIWVVCCLLNFLTASIMGLLMRYSYLFPLNINYVFMLHAHSHVAMLGWAYLMIYVLIVRFFIPKDKSQKPIYNILFWLTEFSVIGMMIAFPIQGYALFSILFSTMHILLSYVFCWITWRDFSKEKTETQRLLVSAILFMILSTFGVWCLGPAINMLGKQSAFYQIAIQFFLHFQFNGWFLFAVLALFLKQFEDEIDKKKFKIFFTLLIIATFLTVAFPVSWYLKNGLLSLINSIGVIIQIIAFVYCCKMFKSPISIFKFNLDNSAKAVYRLAICSVFLKIGIQLLVLIPDLNEVSHQIRNLIIGFVHLTTLGIITGFLFGILIQNNVLSGKSVFLRVGIKFFILGYIATELLLFLQGIFFYLKKGIISYYSESIFLMSILIVSGLILITISLFKNKKQGLIN